MARRLEPDRYLAALLSPRRARQDLVALAAFFGEMAHIPRAVSDPIIGEIRLQWWRDALANVRAGAATGSPVADALGRAIVRHALPEELLLSVIDGRARDLDSGRRGQDLATRIHELAACINETEGAAFRLSARVLAVDESPAVSDLLAAAAQAYGRARIVRSAARADGRTRDALRQDAKTWLGETRRRAAAAPAAVFPAILPVALVEPYLAGLERLGPNIARERAEISPMIRVWRLWRASALGRV